MAQTKIGYTTLEKHQRFLILSLVLSMKGMLKQWTRRFFITNNEKKKRNSREGVTSYLNKKLHKHSGGKSVKGSSMSLNSCSKFGSSKSSNSVTNVFEMPAEISLTELKGYEEITTPTL